MTVRKRTNKRGKKRTVRPKAPQPRTPKKKRTPPIAPGSLWYIQGRWKTSGGRFAKGPTWRTVRRDALGRPIDGRGRRVPATAVTGEQAYQARRKKALDKLKKQIASREKVRKPKLPPRAKIDHVKPGNEVVKRELVSSFYQNKRAPTEAGEILRSYLGSIARKTGQFELEDITLFSYGVKFVGEEPASQSLLDSLAEILGPKGVIKYSETRAGTEIYVQIPSKTGTTIGPAQNRLERESVKLRRIYRELIDQWGELVDWYVWAEVDEFTY